METKLDVKTDVLNHIVLCDQSRGRIKYIGPIHELSNDTGKEPEIFL